MTPGLQVALVIAGALFAAVAAAVQMLMLYILNDLKERIVRLEGRNTIRQQVMDRLERVEKEMGLTPLPR